MKNAPDTSWREILRLRDFRLFWIGGVVSTLGNRFHVVGLPWLALICLGQGSYLGILLAIMAAPRALLMPVFGALADRYSPRALMLAGDVVRFSLVGGLAAAIVTQSFATWMLYLFAALFGVGNAFFYAAMPSLVTQIVPAQQLRLANSINSSAEMLAFMFGSFLGGLVISIFVTSESDLLGIGYALAIDALTFLISIGCLAAMRPRQRVSKSGEAIFSSIKAGLAYTWSEPAFRIVFPFLVFANFILFGPILVGIPTLVKTRLDSALDLGMVLMAMGAGATVGSILGGVLPKPRRFAIVFLLVYSLTGGCLLVLSFGNTLPLVMAAVFIFSVCLGNTGVWGVTWFQSRTEAHYMGRVMSLVMFVPPAIIPFSTLAFGSLSEWSLTLAFFMTGSLLIAVCLLLLLLPSCRSISFDKKDDGIALAQH